MVETNFGHAAELPLWVLEAMAADYAGYDLGVLARRLHEYPALAAPSEREALRVGVTRLQVALASTEIGWFYFARHDIVADAPLNEFELIVCRGLLPSVQEPLRQRAQRLFRESLCPNGMLALGSGESLSARDWTGFRELAGSPDLLRKGATAPC